jgi:hypothetical protein
MADRKVAIEEVKKALYKYPERSQGPERLRR